MISPGLYHMEGQGGVSRVLPGLQLSTPLNLAQIPDLQFWISGRSLSLNSNNVETGEDQSGQSNNATQLDPAAQPLFEPNGFNGKPCILFDGENHFLEAHSVASVFSGDDPSITIILALQVLNSASSELGDSVLSFGNTSDVHQWARLYYNDSLDKLRFQKKTKRCRAGQ